MTVLLPEPGAVYVLDRGYRDFERRHALHQAGCVFVIRAQSNLDVRRRYSAATKRGGGVICDQTIALNGVYSSQHYPAHLRRIRFKDPDRGARLVFLTNPFPLPALTICALYRSRWQIELIFKWIKQCLRIKRFYGTSENAVKTQIWIAVAVYVLMALVRKRLKLEASLHTLLQMLSVTIFDKVPLKQAVLGDDWTGEFLENTNQLTHSRFNRTLLNLDSNLPVPSFPID